MIQQINHLNLEQEINEESQGTYNANSDMQLQASIISSGLFDYCDAYINVKATITVPNTAADAAPVNNTNEEVLLNNYAPFTNCISKINNAQLGDAENIDIAMSMYNVIEYSGVYSKTSGSLQQYYRDEPALDNNNNIIDIPVITGIVFHSNLNRNNTTNRKQWHKKILK